MGLQISGEGKKIESAADKAPLMLKWGNSMEKDSVTVVTGIEPLDHIRTFEPL